MELVATELDSIDLKQQHCLRNPTLKQNKTNRDHKMNTKNSLIQKRKEKEENNKKEMR